MRRPGRAFAIAGAAIVSGCTEGATSDPALTARLRIEGAQFVRGPFPTEAPGAPVVQALDLGTTRAWAGQQHKTLTGTLEASATAVGLGLSGDDGFWLVSARVPNVEAPGLPTFRAEASFAAESPAGAYTLEVRAADARGAFGAPSRQVVQVERASPSAPGAPLVNAPLTVTLAWDTEADLDLHVIDPGGEEIYRGVPVVLADDGGVSAELSYDSNGACAVDGQRQEQIAWRGSPPAGAYLVRVDTFSLCRAPLAHFTVRVLASGAEVTSARGVSVPSDVRGPHDRGAGLLVAHFTLP